MNIVTIKYTAINNFILFKGHDSNAVTENKCGERGGGGGGVHATER